MWGVCTASFSICASLRQGYFFWAINGIGLSLVIPTGQSLIADYYQASNRGKAFGALYLTGSLGGMFGSMYATNLGSHPAVNHNSIFGSVSQLLYLPLQRQNASNPGWKLLAGAVVRC